MKTALFCSGNGTHLYTIANLMKEHPIEPVFFFSNVEDAPCVKKAEVIFPDINIMTMSHKDFSREELDADTNRMVKHHEIELVLFLGYMRVVTPVFLEGAPPIINIHPSLLPAFRGKDAIQQAMDAGVKITGCTAHYVTEELDGGPIISQRHIHIEDKTKAEIKESMIYAEQACIDEALRLHLLNY